MKTIQFTITVNLSDDANKKDIANIQQNISDSLVHTINTVGLVSDDFDGFTGSIEVSTDGLPRISTNLI